MKASHEVRLSLASRPRVMRRVGQPARRSVHRCTAGLCIELRKQAVQHLREAGQGQNGPAPGTSPLPFTSGSITTTQVWDGNGNLLQLIDDRGDVTSFQYDTMDREVLMTFHDGSTRTRVYDEANDVVTYTDENGSVFSNTFDPAGRKVSVSISLATGVVGTNYQSFQYDGLSRMTDSQDSVSGTVAEVVTVYDSLSRVLEESQVYDGATRNVTNAAYTSSPLTGFTFPNGRQLVNYYDVLYRRTLAQDVTNTLDVASWQFFGPSRVAEVALGYGLICTWLNNARTNSAVQSSVSNPSWGNQSSDRLGYDGAGRPITKRFLSGSVNGTTHAYNDTTAAVGFTTAYDRSSNKLYERSLHCEERDHLYQAFDPTTNWPVAGCYDSLGRLLQYQRGVFSATGGPGNAGGGSISTAITLPNTNTEAEYVLDGLGNWRRFITDPVGGSLTTEVRQHNGVNQITRVSVVGTNTNFAYDHGDNGSNSDPSIARRGNGNLANDGIRSYTWDALNRLVQVNRVSDGAIIQQSVYDAMNRRIQVTVSNGGLSGTIPNGTTDFIYSGWRRVEERQTISGTDTPTKQYIWGIYLDECLQQYNYVALNGFGADEELYPLQDLLYRTIALADSSGVIREAYDYDAYGNTLIFRNSGSPPTAIAWDDSDTQVAFPTCDVLFTGQKFDAETSIYYYKEREYIPEWGRFASRDPIGYDARDWNLYRYVSNGPTTFSDPTGREAAAALGGCVAGAIGAGVGTLLVQWWNGRGWCWKKAGCSAVGGCVTGGLIGAFPSWQAGCIGGGLGSLATAACEAAAGLRGPLDKCDVYNMTLNVVLGCISGISAEAAQSKIEVILTLLGFDAAVWSDIAGC